MEVYWYTARPVKEVARLCPETTRRAVGKVWEEGAHLRTSLGNCADQDRLWVCIIINFLAQ